MLAAALAALLVLVEGSAQAAPGGLRASFGSAGEVTTTFSTKSDDVVQALALQVDGKIVVAGYSFGGSPAHEADFALARYGAAGRLDRSFGGGGKVTTGFGSTSEFAYGLALQPDGKIVAAGETLVNRPDFDFALARYNADGTLDQGFGSGGKVTTTFGSTGDLAQALALQPDGKIVVAGSSGFPEQRDEVFALVRYNRDGTLDSSFGSGGKVTTSFSSRSDDHAQALALQPDGKIVAVGSNFVASREGSSDFALARYLPGGALDPGFGDGGKVTTTFGSASGDFANAVVLQPDGKIVVAGYSFFGSVAGHSEFALARYKPDGALDPSFGSGGKLTTDFSVAGSSAWAVGLQPDGKIVAAGNGDPGTFALARYDSDGSLDAGFGSGGKLTTPVGLSGEGTANALALAPDGKIVAAGWSVTCTYQDFALTRYELNGSLDKSFGQNGKRCLVPNVRGKTLGAAKRAIKRRDCSVGPISKVFSRKVGKGRVIAQWPHAGTHCFSGTKVVLRVSKGKRKRG